MLGFLGDLGFIGFKAQVSRVWDFKLQGISGFVGFRIFQAFRFGFFFGGGSRARGFLRIQRCGFRGLKAPFSDAVQVLGLQSPEDKKPGIHRKRKVRVRALGLCRLVV